MNLYIISYSKDRPKPGHKVVTHKKVVEADGATAAMLKFLNSNGLPTNLYYLDAEYAGMGVLS